MNWRKPVIYALLYAGGSRIPRNLREMRRVWRFSESHVKEYQLGKLAEMLRYAAQHVPYYQRVLAEAEVVVDGTVRIENFQRIPLLTKDIIRREGVGLHAKNHAARGSYENTSGGSTGEPVRFLQDKAYDDMNTATKIFFFEVLGKHIGEREVKLWGSDRDILAGSLTLRDRAINFLYNRRFFNCYDFTREHRLRLVELNNTFKPMSYWAYVDASFEFATFVLENRIKLVPPKLIVATIGPLYPNQKEIIERAFQCKVYNQYGSRETGAVCCHDRKADEMNVFFWRQFIEVLPVENSRSDEDGKIVMTSLDNFSMPLIRYDIGDVAVKGSTCYEIHGITSCLSLKNVIGRTLGFFKKADGTLFHTHFLVQQLFFKDWIARFQIAQEAYDRIVIRIVPAKDKNERDMQKIVENVHVLVGDCRIEFEFVDEIKPSPSGKVLYTVCNVP